jgi:hypothetical protein
MDFRHLPPRPDPCIRINMEMAASLFRRLYERAGVSGPSIRPSTSAAPATQCLGVQP